jgi:hypothetical protein
LPKPRPGRLAGDVYSNDWLGIVGRVPPGMNAEIGDDVDLLIQRSDIVVSGGLAYSTRVTTVEQIERTFESVHEGFRSALQKSGLVVPTVVRSSGKTRTALGEAIERSWGAGNSALEVRMLLIPICAGTGSIVFVQMYADPYARSVLDGWMASFRFTKGRNLEACGYLDPK